MDLVDKKDYTRLEFGFVDDFSDVFDPSIDCRQGIEGGLDLVGYDICNGRLAYPWRAPKD
jgi:hypothetical protein